MKTRSVLGGLALAACAAIATVSCKDSNKVTAVWEPIGSVSISAPTAPPTVLRIGETHQFTAVVRDASGDIADRKFTIRYTSSNAAIITVSASGLATAVGPGTATVTADVEGTKGEASILVLAPVAAVEVAGAQDTVIAGAQVQFTAVPHDAEGNVLSRDIAWTSSDPAKATVDASGLVTTLAEGTVAIGAESEGLNGSATLVILPAVASVSLSEEAIQLPAGSALTLVATPKDAHGNSLDRPVVWTSDDPATATVVNGLVTGVAVGQTTVYAASEGRRGSAAVTVVVPAARVIVSGGGNEPLEIGLTLQLAAIVEDANGNWLQDRVLTWTSSSPAIATVDASGLVTGVSRGTAVISATVEGVSGSADVRVVGGETTTELSNNLSYPVIFAEGISLLGEPVTTGDGLRPGSEEGIEVDALPFFYAGNTPDCGPYFCQQGRNVWQAEWMDGSQGPPRRAEVAWGDNLTHHQWNTHSQIRVEVTLYDMDVMLQGFNMPYSAGTGETEMQGTDGSTALFPPTIYASTPRLVVEKLDDVTREPVYTAFDGAVWQGYGQDGPGFYGAEVNVAGKVVYGFNFVIRDAPVPSDIHKYGWWRLTFKLDDQGHAGGASVLRNLRLEQIAPSTEGEEGETRTFTPQISPDGLSSWLDIEVTSASGGGGGGH